MESKNVLDPLEMTLKNMFFNLGVYFRKEFAL